MYWLLFPLHQPMQLSLWRVCCLWALRYVTGGWVLQQTNTKFSAESNIRNTAMESGWVFESSTAGHITSATCSRQYENTTECYIVKIFSQTSASGKYFPNAPNILSNLFRSTCMNSSFCQNLSHGSVIFQWVHLMYTFIPRSAWKGTRNYWGMDIVPRSRPS